ncbi:MAG TPA: iron-sulfur cluster assembly accessory protein [Gammaproteobacteria bacterium]|nr:iron-sulfur cluster assembly accessory protein [Gammaproteobacteria bacterium]
MSEAAVQFDPQLKPEEVTVTPAAAEQLAQLLAQSEDEMAGIRIFVSGGGCSGLTYGMTYTDRTTPFDKILEGDGFRLMVDSVALGYLRGCEIDFRQQGLNASFVFNNVFQSVGGSGACGGCGGAAGGGCA